MNPLPVAERAAAGLSRRAILRRCPTSHPDRLQRRQYSTPKQDATPNPQPLSPPPTSANSIPGPIWLWTEPLNSYSRAHSRRPYTVQLISSLIIYLIGDITAQSIAPTPRDESTSGSGSSHDPARTMRALIIGGTAAIPGYHWFLYLARNFNYTSKVFSIVVKVLINQVVFTPIFNTYFFGMQSLLTGASWRDIVERVQNTVPTSLKNSWKLWPPVTAFSFAFVRVELRGLFAGVIAIGWQAYLSSLNQKAAREEQSVKEDQGVVGKSTHRYP